LVPSLEKFFPAGWTAGQRKLIVHIDNALANARITQNIFGYNPLKRLSHPLYFPGLSPSDFSMFRKIKNALVEREITDQITFLETVTQILNGISDVELQRVLRSWIEHVERVIAPRCQTVPVSPAAAP
jgi:hypothetical protein